MDSSRTEETVKGNVDVVYQLCVHKRWLPTRTRLRLKSENPDNLTQLSSITTKSRIFFSHSHYHAHDHDDVPEGNENAHVPHALEKVADAVNCLRKNRCAGCGGWGERMWGMEVGLCDECGLCERQANVMMFCLDSFR